MVMVQLQASALDRMPSGWHPVLLLPPALLSLCCCSTLLHGGVPCSRYAGYVLEVCSNILVVGRLVLLGLWGLMGFVIAGAGQHHQRYVSAPKGKVMPWGVLSAALAAIKQLKLGRAAGGGSSSRALQQCHQAYAVTWLYIRSDRCRSRGSSRAEVQAFRWPRHWHSSMECSTMFVANDGGTRLPLRGCRLHAVPVPCSRDSRDSRCRTLHAVAAAAALRLQEATSISYMACFICGTWQVAGGTAMAHVQLCCLGAASGSCHRMTAFAAGVCVSLA